MVWAPTATIARRSSVPPTTITSTPACLPSASATDGLWVTNVPDESVLGGSVTYYNARAMLRLTWFFTPVGIAALWLDFHRDDPALASLRSQGAVTAAFRNALQAAAWRPDRRKDSSSGRQGPQVRPERPAREASSYRW